MKYPNQIPLPTTLSPASGFPSCLEQSPGLERLFVNQPSRGPAPKLSSTSRPWLCASVSAYPPVTATLHTPAPSHSPGLCSGAALRGHLGASRHQLSVTACCVLFHSWQLLCMWAPLFMDLLTLFSKLSPPGVMFSVILRAWDRVGIRDCQSPEKTLQGF